MGNGRTLSYHFFTSPMTFVQWKGYFW